MQHQGSHRLPSGKPGGPWRADPRRRAIVPRKPPRLDDQGVPAGAPSGPLWTTSTPPDPACQEFMRSRMANFSRSDDCERRTHECARHVNPGCAETIEWDRAATEGSRPTREAGPVRQTVTLPAPLAEEVRRVAHARNLTRSRALVALAERGVRAEQEARQNLKAAYRRFVKEQEPVRKEQAGKDLIRAIFEHEAIAEDSLIANLPRGFWQHLLERVQQCQVSLSPT